VLPERCIGCGNCVCVCSQRAKRVARSVETVEALLAGAEPVAACVAPSFAAEFAECEAGRLVGMLRALGFAMVTEVGFGADLVADRYRRLVRAGDDRRYIATTCPAVVAYVERYHPNLVASLAPIVSPMVAQARALRRLHGEALRVVFIGPCIAKKGESRGPDVAGDVDAVLTFAELREMFGTRSLLPASVEDSEFDPPRPGPGALFPIGGGLLQAADIPEDLLTGEVIAADGRTGFVEAIKEFEAGDLSPGLLEVLACSGCIMGPGMGGQLPLFGRRARVSQYVRARMATLNRQRWREDMKRFADLDLSRSFQTDDQRFPAPSAEELAAIMGRMGKYRPEDELNCGACGYDTCREHAMAIHRGLADSETCLPYSIERLRESRDELARTQEALLQSEKLASMGQLAAGIAHELNNPLGVVLMYAHILQEDYGGNDPALTDDLQMLSEQADRCKRIVAGLLHFARQDRVELRPVDLREAVEHALKAAPAPEGIEVRVEHALEDETAELDPDQVVQVLVNLATNAYAAMPRGGTLTLETSGDEATVRVRVTDTGVGIRKEILSKVFEPFFTTKTIGKGTGLGLAVAYGIVKMHRGDIRVASNADPAAGPTGTTFTVTFPRQREPETFE
jgi:signal transduction histidine kinase